MTICIAIPGVRPRFAKYELDNVSTASSATSEPEAIFDLLLQRIPSPTPEIESSCRRHTMTSRTRGQTRPMSNETKAALEAVANSPQLARR